MLIGEGWGFLHIPKCGGTTVRALLDGIEIGDWMPMGQCCAVRSPWHRLPKYQPLGVMFTLVRHPAQWIRSYWCDQSPSRLGRRRYLHRYWSDSLDKFALRLCEGHPGYVSEMMSAYVDKWPGTLVFRVEDGISKAIRFATGIKVPEIRENSSGRKPRLSKEAMAAIMEAESYGISRFGYRRNHTSPKRITHP